MTATSQAAHEIKLALPESVMSLHLILNLKKFFVLIISVPNFINSDNIIFSFIRKLYFFHKFFCVVLFYISKTDYRYIKIHVLTAAFHAGSRTVGFACDSCLKIFQRRSLCWIVCQSGRRASAFSFPTILSSGDGYSPGCCAGTFCAKYHLLSFGKYFTFSR